MAEPVFYEHCEDPSCDLGYVECACPVCKRKFTCYEAFWTRRYEVWNGETAESECEHCKAPLVMRLGPDRFPEVVCKPV